MSDPADALPADPTAPAATGQDARTAPRPEASPGPGTAQARGRARRSAPTAASPAAPRRRSRRDARAEPAPSDAPATDATELDDLIARAAALRDADRLADARAVHAEILARLGDHPGPDPARRIEALADAAGTERLAGHHASAADLADEALALAGTTGADPWRPAAVRAHLDVLLGRLDHGRAAAEVGLAAAEAQGEPAGTVPWRHVLGLAALLEGDAAAAGHLLAARDAALAAGRSEPSQLRLDADLVEALLAAGRHGDAEAALADLRRRGTARLPWTIAATARAEALVRTASGRPEAAVEALRAAAATIESLPFPLERGRTLMAWGVALRAMGRRNAARAALTAAAEAIAPLPSPPWEARVRAELAGLRRPPGPVPA